MLAISSSCLLRLYAEILAFQEEKRTIPEWAEDVLYYIIRKCWDMLSTALDEFDVQEEDKATFLEKFGKPQELAEVGDWIFSSEWCSSVCHEFSSSQVAFGRHRGEGTSSDVPEGPSAS
jgi:hypothetical protein